MAGVPYVFGNATTSIPLTNLDANFNTGLTIGNTTVGLGNTVTTLGNVTLTNATIVGNSSSIAANAVVYTSPTGNLTGNVSVFSAVNQGAQYYFGLNNTSPTEVLHVTGLSSSPQLVLERTTTNTGKFALGTASNQFLVIDQVAGQTRMLIDSTGKVGIGTSSPGATLEVNGSTWVDFNSGTTIIGGQARTITGSIGIEFQPQAATGCEIGTGSSFPMVLYTNGTERMRFTAAGDINLGSGINLNNSSGRPILKQTGSIIQVVSAARSPTSQTNSSTYNTWITTNTKATITPSSTSSKILILICEALYYNNGGGTFPNINAGIQRAISGGATTNGIGGFTVLYQDNRSTGAIFGQQEIPCHVSYVDSPATTSAVTYTFQFNGASNSAGTSFANMDYNSAGLGTNGFVTLMEIAG